MLARTDCSFLLDDFPAPEEPLPRPRSWSQAAAPAPERLKGIPDAFDLIGCACVSLDAAAQVVRMNDAARAHLGRGLTLCGRQLVASDRDSNDALQELVRQVLGGRARHEVRFSACATLARPEARPLVVHACRCAERNGGLVEHSGAMLIIVDPDERQEPGERIVRQVFGLTGAEARLAVALVRGLELKEIAAANGVAEATIRSQLKSVLAKTGTHRQSQLVALVSRLARLPPRAD